MASIRTTRPKLPSLPVSHTSKADPLEFMCIATPDIASPLGSENSSSDEFDLKEIEGPRNPRSFFADLVRYVSGTNPKKYLKLAAEQIASMAESGHKPALDFIMKVCVGTVSAKWNTPEKNYFSVRLELLADHCVSNPFLGDVFNCLEEITLNHTYSPAHQKAAELLLKMHSSARRNAGPKQLGGVDFFKSQKQPGSADEIDIDSAVDSYKAYMQRLFEL
jgi:hypothetical protein